MAKMIAVVVMVTLLAFSALVEPSSAQAWKLPKPGPPRQRPGVPPFRRECRIKDRCRGGIPAARKLLTIVKNVEHNGA
ncbi:hypothetical protein SASPL_113848 [Salvia splendens]|uniref:Uncharacterized protein n=1 Tax=Salvia splendens TaxID=180675 RepID=A0A8X8ZYT2_SALSN|nr:hypothetical protein SASPL_113848 [Salvia splendens]